MKKLFVLVGVLSSVFGADAYADVVLDAQEAFRIAGQVCSGISDEIKQVANMGKVNTAVTAVGTVAGGGALAVGISKSQVDKQIEQLEQQLSQAGCTDADNVLGMSNEQFFNGCMPYLAEIAQLTQLQEKSENLGNWRTGLLAGAGATHIASAVMSGINVNQSDLTQHIIACNNAIKLLEQEKQKLQVAGVNPYENPIRGKIDNALGNCMALDVADVDKIENREKWVLGSSVVGGTAAVVGVATSATAIADAVRDDKQKAKNLNTTANVMAGVSTVGSGVATGFNVSIVTLTKKMISQAERCEQVFGQ